MSQSMLEYAYENGQITLDEYNELMFELESG